MSLTLAVARLGGVLESTASPVLKTRDLTVERWRLIDALALHGPRPMSELAELAVLTGPTMTRIADSLCERALTYRIPDPVDRRRLLLKLSDRGVKLQRRLAPQIEAAQRRAIAELREEDARAMVDPLVATMSTVRP